MIRAHTCSYALEVTFYANSHTDCPGSSCPRKMQTRPPPSNMAEDFHWSSTHLRCRMGWGQSSCSWPIMLAKTWRPMCRTAQEDPKGMLIQHFTLTQMLCAVCSSCVSFILSSVFNLFIFSQSLGLPVFVMLIVKLSMFVICQTLQYPKHQPSD